MQELGSTPPRTHLPTDRARDSYELLGIKGRSSAVVHDDTSLVEQSACFSVVEMTFPTNTKPWKRVRCSAEFFEI